jgi:hypothetical protein
MQQDRQPPTVVAQGGHDYVKELQRALARGGVRAELVRPPKEHCGT